MTAANNVTRMLDAKKIIYTAHALPEEKLSAVEAAEWIGVSPDLVYKTIVAVRTTPGKPVLAVVPGNRELDLKRLAQAMGEKKVKVASHQQAEELTGLQTGGISPLALINKGFQVFIDEHAAQVGKFYVSGGQRGLNIEISPKDLARLTNARFALIASA
ncbi:MAG: aminoacyl-tRNA deacylase [Anaerolineales bacterium]|jgi:Cys-tRNA(Pro)/Cys-tRNA(Cys) deacylase